MTTTTRMTTIPIEQAQDAARVDAAQGRERGPEDFRTTAAFHHYRVCLGEYRAQFAVDARWAPKGDRP